MSDQRHDDWTDGPELSAEAAQARREGVEAASGSESESVRLAEIRLLDRWIGDVLAEQRRSRRWKIFFRLLFVGVVIAGLALSAYGLLLAQGQDAASGERHLGVVDVWGPSMPRGRRVPSAS
ncbi:hypothetical protein [Salinicola tamaricis]|uniref:hypothetical protein n=1 Tax=Salinicola tamaricis TaxID=1771309 RepID=UPI0030F385D0